MKAIAIIQMLLIWLIAYSAITGAWAGMEMWLYGYTQPSVVDACIAVWLAAKITADDERKGGYIMTNYDRIKSMSMEEMADMLDNIEDIACGICNSKYCAGYRKDGLCPAENKVKYCHKATLKWLESGVTP